MSWRTWWARRRETEDQKLARLYPEAGSKAADARDLDELHRGYIRKMFGTINGWRAADARAIRRHAARIKAARAASMVGLMGQQQPRRRWVPWFS